MTIAVYSKWHLYYIICAHWKHTIVVEIVYLEVRHGVLWPFRIFIYLCTFLNENFIKGYSYDELRTAINLEVISGRI